MRGGVVLAAQAREVAYKLMTQTDQTLEQPAADHAVPDPPPSGGVLVVLNPVAGTHDPAQVRQVIEDHLSADGQALEWYETTGDEYLPDVAREAAERGFRMVIAVGGDGTVSEVASGLVHSNTALGIIPVGTANVLAHELHIPFALEAACRLLTGEQHTTRIDAMQVNDRFFFLHIGMGLDALVMRDTQREHKRRFGIFAYIWTGLTLLFGYQPRRFVIVADGKRHRRRASQVVIANGSTFGISQLRLGSHIHPDDGFIDICVLYAQRLPDYLTIAWHFLTRRHGRERKIRYYRAHQSVIINTHSTLPIQADGEILEQFPLHVRVVPRAVSVIVPPSPDD
jgi:YegS/Rv2252/BmrU family lipid kinase